MEEELTLIIEDAGEKMQKAIQHLESELVKIRAGKANPQMLEGVQVEYYGSMVPLHQVANITATDARTIVVQPWEKQMVPVIEKAIISANLGFNPQNDGQMIRIFLPPLTEERRRDLVKRVNAEGEQAKIAIRNIRREAIEEVKKLQKNGLSEDQAKDSEEEIQQLTNKFITLVDKYCAAKEKEIMAV
ncbi:MAG: ribosome recycling factor [Thermoflavifilum sp.]|nr:ribosome recycling factor [Thermoflavifilum sp.]